MNILSKEATEAISLLNDNGYEAYAVGGCVRDMLMQRQCDDIDITTNASPEEIKKVFSAFRTVDTGIKHGTVTVIINSLPIEITTYRIETGYSDSRHPDSVIFTKNIEEDLKRRDFTVNSIAYHHSLGYVDLWDGIKDIENKIIRCVGEPEERFREDALRIMRALRFSSVLGFEIEKETEKALFTCKELLKNVSAERIYTELIKLLCGENVRDVLTKYSEILEIILPEIKNMKGFDQKNHHHIYDILTHTAVVTENIPPLPHLRLAALFHDCGKPECFSVDDSGTGHFYSHASKSAEKAENALLRLRCDNSTREKVVRLVKTHDAPIEESERIIKKKLRSLGEDLFFDLIKLQRADTKGLAPIYHDRKFHFDTLEATAKKIIDEQQCFSLKDLALNGKDLINLGLKGKEIGDMLSMLLEAVIDGKLPNEKEQLIKYANSQQNK